MFCTVQVNGNLPVGTVVQFNTENQTWDTASTAQDTIGVIREAPIQNEDDLTWWARVVFAGVVEALADRDIQVQGGRLNVSNGKDGAFYAHNKTRADCMSITAKIIE